jgi:hypothetical protein
MAWKHPGSPTKKKFKTQSSAGKVMPTVFWDFLKHPAYSPDLALPTIISLDCSKMLYEVVDFLQKKEVVHKWLRNQPKTFFLEGIRKPVDRWTKCIEKEGNYVEK